jgi:hypothetical protein
MSNVRGLRDPRKRWVMQFELQLEADQLLPVLLCYEPALKGRLDEIRALCTEAGSIDVSTWWERVDTAPEVEIGVVLSHVGSDEPTLDLTITLPTGDWEAARHRAAARARETVLISLTANPAVLQLQNDDTSWEAEVPLGEGLVRRETQVAEAE